MENTENSLWVFGIAVPITLCFFLSLFVTYVSLVFFYLSFCLSMHLCSLFCLLFQYSLFPLLQILQREKKAFSKLENSGGLNIFLSPFLLFKNIPDLPPHVFLQQILPSNQLIKKVSIFMQNNLLFKTT